MATWVLVSARRRVVVSWTVGKRAVLGVGVVDDVRRLPRLVRVVCECGVSLAVIAAGWRQTEVKKKDRQLKDQLCLKSLYSFIVNVYVGRKEATKITARCGCFAHNSWTESMD